MPRSMPVPLEAAAYSGDIAHVFQDQRQRQAQYFEQRIWGRPENAINTEGFGMEDEFTRFLAPAVYAETADIDNIDWLFQLE
jgi:hypothetical protein